MGTEAQYDATKGEVMGKLDGKVAVITGGSIFMTGSVASVKGYPSFSVCSESKAALRSFARGWLN